MREAAFYFSLPPLVPFSWHTAKTMTIIEQEAELLKQFFFFCLFFSRIACRPQATRRRTASRNLPSPIFFFSFPCLLFSTSSGCTRHEPDELREAPSSSPHVPRSRKYTGAMEDDRNESLHFSFSPFFLAQAHNAVQCLLHAELFFPPLFSYPPSLLLHSFARRSELPGASELRGQYWSAPKNRRTPQVHQLSSFFFSPPPKNRIFRTARGVSRRAPLRPGVMAHSVFFRPFQCLFLTALGEQDHGNYRKCVRVRLVGIFSPFFFSPAAQEMQVRSGRAPAKSQELSKWRGSFSFLPSRQQAWPSDGPGGKSKGCRRFLLLSSFSFLSTVQVGTTVTCRKSSQTPPNQYLRKGQRFLFSRFSPHALYLAYGGGLLQLCWRGGDPFFPFLFFSSLKN